MNNDGNTSAKAFSPAFTLDSGDRFRSIIVSHPIIYPSSPGSETILTFFIIRRSSGNYSIVNVMKTYQKGECVSRNIQQKNDIPEKRIEMESKAIKAVFTYSLEEKSGARLLWEVLELSGITDMKEQVRLIQEWDRIKAYLDDPDMICLQ